MWKRYSVSIYPKENPDYERIERYIIQAKKYGCQEIFSSAHLPELDEITQYEFIIYLSNLVHDYGMKLCVDFGGKQFVSLLGNKYYTDLLREAHIDSIRLDYGIDPNLVINIQEVLDIHTFIINASILNEEEVKKYLKYDVELKACHNFYPRILSGLDESFVVKQYCIFKALGIDVVSCVPSHTHPRGPIYEGLPTVEKHRYMDMEKCLLEIGQYCEEILLGDEWISDEELEKIFQIGFDKKVKVRVLLENSITEKEKNIVLNEHKFRYDSNSIILRSQSSREMAELATKIEPNNIIEKERGSITIDNIHSKRYSGELQIVCQKLDKDYRVNVVGKIKNEDMWKLDYFREGFTYQFIGE